MPKWIEKECPRCHKVFTGWPAMSREDNATEICSDCGSEEAHMGLIRPDTRPVIVGDEPEDSLN